MEWLNKVKINWDEMSNKEEKMLRATKIANKVKHGDIIGFGSGSASYLAIIEIAKKIKEENINILAIPTSYETKMLCNELGIPTTTILENKPDWSFDGADEVDQNNCLIKGRGAAMFKEKLNMVNSPITYILVDKSKFVKELGEKTSIPIEVFPEAGKSVKEELADLGAEKITLRLAKGKNGPVITENNNVILDVKFIEIYDSLEKDIKSITGVIESGLFIGYNIEIIK